MSFNLYTAQYHGSPNHVALFLETNTSGDGTLYHVVGNILNGMNYETKAGKRPDDSITYVPGSKVFIGTIKQADVGQLDAICRSVAPPAKQLKLNGAKIDPSKPLRRCGEWVVEVVDELREQEVLEN